MNKTLKLKVTAKGEATIKDLQTRSNSADLSELTRKAFALYDMMITLKVKGYTFMATAEGELPKEIEII
jgi:hypothetical protein